MKSYCCLQLEDAVLKGWVREETFIHEKPMFNVFIVEMVIKKRMNKKWLIFKQEEIDTKEVILKNCIYCGAVLT